MSSVLVLAGVTGMVACSHADPWSTSQAAWSCGEAPVPYGERVECTTQGLSLPAGVTFTCNDGVFNPNCPPPASGSTTDFNPDATTGTGGGSTSSGGTTDVPPGASSSGSGSGSTTGSRSGSTSGGGSTSSGGTTDVPPGASSSGSTGSGSGSSGGGSNSSSGTTTGSSSGSTGGSGSGGASGSGSGTCTTGADAGGGSDAGVGTAVTFSCISNPPAVTCDTPPTCSCGTHPSPCGACVPDGTNDDCVPPSEGGCWVTGGGFIVGDAGSNDSFGGNAMPMKSGTVRGEWENQDHATGDDMHGQPNYIFCRTVPGAGPGHPNGPKHNFDENQAYFGGPARYMVAGASWADGYWFDVVVEDHGEPGTADTYQITIRQYAGATTSGAVVFQTSGTLSGGNIQLHPPNPGHPDSQSTLPPWVQLQP